MKVSESLAKLFDEYKTITKKFQDLDLREVVFEEKRLDNVAKIIMGQSPKSEYINQSRLGLPFHQGKTEFGEKYINEAKFWTTNSKKNTEAGSVLISMRAPAGVVNITSYDVSIGRGLAGLNAFMENDNDYLFYFLQNYEQDILLNSSDSGIFSSITKDYLLQIPISIPKSLNETYTSKKIQEVLVELIEYCQSRQQYYLGKLEHLYSLLDKMDKTVLPAVLEKKPDAIYWFDEMMMKWNEVLRLGEVEFNKLELDKIASLSMGQSPEGSNVNSQKIGMPFHQGKTLFGEKYIKEADKWTNEPKRTATQNDILISMRAPAGVVNFASYDLAIGRGLAVVRGKDTIDQNYLYEVLKYNESKINDENTGTGFFSSMTVDYLKKLEIPVPKDTTSQTSKQIQTQIVRFVEDKYAYTNSLRKKGEHLTSLMQHFMDTLMRSIFEI